MKNVQRGTLGIAILIRWAGTYATDCNFLPKQDASEATIKELEQQWSRAFYTGDSAFLECQYASNFRNVDSKGAMETYPHAGANLWRVDYRSNGWGTPRRLSDAINQGSGKHQDARSTQSRTWADSAQTGFRFRVTRAVIETIAYLREEQPPIGDNPITTAVHLRPTDFLELLCEIWTDALRRGRQPWLQCEESELAPRHGAPPKSS